MSKYRLLAVACLLGVLAGELRAEVPKGVQFKADYYQRDLSSNTLRGKGNAWIRSGGQELFGDEIEVDFGTNLGTASGHVRMVDGDTQVTCAHASFNLKGQDATFDKATLASGQMVVTGETIRRINALEYEVLEATYSNCNVDQIAPPEAGICPMDWKFSGRRFRITMGGYAHFYDVMVSAKGIPFFYTPYAMIPVKTERETGFLMPTMPWTATLGTGVGLPFFWAINEWSDLLIRPTYYSSTGVHLGLNYRYAYSPDKNGTFNLFLASRRFSGPDNPNPDDTSRGRWLGIWGEGAVEAMNIYRLTGSRLQSRQMLNFVSNPYYTYDYAADVGRRADLGNLRSQVTLTMPGDEWMMTAQAQYLQSLVVSVPNEPTNPNTLNIDGGGASQLPIITVAKTTTPFLGQLFSYELDTQFTNFTRSTATDVLTNNSLPSTITPLAAPVDYVRTGRRLQIEPRLVFNVPAPAGFQIQPLLRTGTLFYQFDAPQPAVRHREYLEVEIPFAMQMSRVFNTSIAGFEKVSHVFQPRFIYSGSLLQTGGDDHAFFYTDAARGLSNPRFDIIDQITPFEYMRFELINRFQRKNGDKAERFFWFQVSEQYNLKTSASDPRFINALGPIELFSSLSLGKYSMQLTATFPLQETTKLLDQAVTPVRESTVSTGISYAAGGKNLISLNGLYRLSANPALNAQMANLYLFQELPTFFDFEGSVEYNFITHKIYGYKVGLHFRSKPRSCWAFSVAVGQNSFGTQFTNLGFNLNLGSPSG